MWLVDHFTGFLPRSIWTKDLSWLAGGTRSPDAFFDWQVLAGHLASRLGRLRLAVGVTEPIRRHPVLLAQSALTLSHLTKQPPILGIGPGERENIEPYGLSFDRPVAKLEEALMVIRRCFDSTKSIDFGGEFYRLDQASMDLTPGRAGRPEIWLGAHGPRMLRLCGRFGDGWYPTIPLTPDGYAEGLGIIRRQATAAGRDPAAIVPSMRAWMVVGRTDRQAREYLSHPAVRFLALLTPDTSWRAAGLEHPLGPGFRGMVDIVPSRYGRAELEAAIDRVQPEFVAEQAIWGTPDRIVARIRELGETGLRHVVLSPVSALVSRRAAGYALWAIPKMVRLLRSGHG